MKSITIGLDLAKHVFRVRGVDDDGNVIFRRRLRQPESPPLLNACRSRWLAWGRVRAPLRGS
jgi:hypothetical protein